MLHRHTLSRVATILALSAISCTGSAFAQSTTTGAILGTVQDPSGSVSPGAAITITNNSTNARVMATADGSGSFKVAQLQPGTYTVAITAAGFSNYQATNVQVEVGQPTTIKPVLAVESAGTETVSVSGAASLINTESPDFSTNLNREEIESLPINGRRWSDLTLLTPGVVSDSNGFGLLSVRGISPLLNNVEIDGADDNQAYFSEERGRTREGYSTPQVAIQEFQVNTGVYSTEYGRALGAVINSVTKSGGNQMHGELYFYDRDNDWGAENPYTKLSVFDGTTGTTTTTQYKPKDWRKQFGFGVGGPLIKDKLFWFYTFDGFRRNFPGTGVAASPAAFFRAPDAVIADKDAQGKVITCAEILSTTGKTQPVNPVDAQACALQARLKLATYGAAVTLYNTDLGALSKQLGPVTRYGDQNINLPKLDWQVNSKNHVSFLYNRLRWDSPGGVQTQATNTYSTDSFGNDFVKLDYGLVRLDTIVTNNIANELRYQYGRELNDETAQKPTAYDQQFITGSSYQGLPPSISLQSSNGFTDGTPYYSFRPAYPDERKWQVADTVSWVRGQHSFKFGGDIVHNYDQINSLSLAASTPNGQFTYTYLANFFADLAQPSGTCGSSASEYNVGTLPCYTSFAQNFGQGKFDLATTDYGFFFQDSWKLTPRLTADYGIRYDYQSVPGPYKNLLQASGSFTPLAEESNKPDDKNNIGPRVGFAYDTFGTGKTVLRGGFGLYYARMLNATILTAYTSTGSPLGQISDTFKNNQKGPTFSNILPANFSPTSLAAANAQYFDKNFQSPEALEYDLTLQQQFGAGTVFSMSYLASQSRFLPNFINENLLNTPAANNNSTNGKGYTTVNYTVTPQGGATATSTSNCGPLKCGSTYTAKVYNGYTNPNFQAITRIVSNINASYNALVFQLDNQSNKYATFHASYTWSHALDYNQNASTQASTNVPLDPNASLRSQYGNSSFNVPNRFIAYALFKYPDFFRSGLLHEGLDGWNLNPLVQLQNGLPYSLTTSSYPSSNAVSTGWNGTGGTAFVPALGRNSYTLRRDEVFDVRAQKNVALPRDYSLQLIGECFNVFNHENFTSINSTGYIFGGSAAGVAGATYTGPQTYTTQLQYSPTFGQYTNANSNYAYSPRQVQVAVRLQF